MATDLQTQTPPAGASVVDTVTGIVHDFETLMKQQFAMYKAEMKADWDKTKSALVPLIAGGALLLPAGLMFCFMFVHLIHWLSAPPVEDLGRIPLWGCFGIVGFVLALAGGILVIMGVQRFHSFTPVPEQSNQALKENVRWLTNPK